jgi:hypothetical protein
MARPNASSSMSPILYNSLIEMYRNAIKNFSNSNSMGFQYKINFMTTHAIAVIPLAVTVWEAHLNEQILGKITWPEFRENIISTNKELRDLIERADIKAKSILLPQIFYGNTFNKGSNPYQDFTKLIDIRNAIVHYKPYDYPKSAIDYLDQKKITLNSPKNSNFAWPMPLYSTECMRWAINTICSMILEMDKFKPGLKDGTDLIFKPISIERAKEIFSEFNVDHSNIDEEYRDEQR